MKTRFGGSGGAVLCATLLAGFAAGCGSDGALLGNDGGVDGLPISTGTGGTVVRDATADQPTDVPEEHGPTGLGGAFGTAGASGTGGALGLAGMSGMGGMGTGGMGVGGTGIAGMGAGGMGTGGAGTGGTGVGGAGVGGTGVGGMGVGGMGVGGTGVGGMGVGGTGVGGMGVGGTGVGGSTAVDAGVGTDGAVDAAPATLTQIWNEVLGNQGAAPAPGCRVCHNGGGGIPDYTSTTTAFATLVNQPSISCTGTRVVPGNAETSVLINKLRSGSGFGLATVCGGTPMPRGNRNITLAQLHMIESWINAGALPN